MRKNLIVTFMLVALAAFVLASCTSAQPPAQTAAATQQVQLQAAPSFEVQTIEGRTVSTEEYKANNKPMVVYFMASTCSTCAKNWANINEVYPEYKGKVDLVAISVDPTDDNAVLTKLAQDKGFTFETVAGNPAIAVQYEVKKQTAKFAIDKDGNIVSRHDGLLTPQEWKDLFESVA